MNIVNCLTNHHGRNSGEDSYVSHPLKAGGNLRHDESHDTYVTHTLRAEGHDASEDGTGRGTPLIAATLNSGGNSGGFRTEPGEHLVAAYQCHGSNVGPMGTFRAGNGNETGGVPFIAFDERNVTSKENRSSPKPGDPCQTLHSDAPRLAGTMGVRRLMPVECERLQGFPDNWTIGSDSARYRMLGNAVCVPVAEWIGQRLHCGPRL